MSDATPVLGTIEKPKAKRQAKVKAKGNEKVAPLTPEQAQTLPQHLERPRAGVPTFGTLRSYKSKGERFWLMEGDPQAIMTAKRLFPAAEGRGPGSARFPITPRLFQDLVWFLQRYPMEILDEGVWEDDYQAACKQHILRTELNARPVSALPAPDFKGILRPFQGEALAWMMANRRTLNADDMGLGKTPVALSMLATIKEWPALIVPQAHITDHWVEQCQKFLQVDEEGMPLFMEGVETPGVIVHVIRGLKPYVLPKAHIYICHYLLLRSWRAALRELVIPTIIFDEVQELRHTGSEKYSAASELSGLATTVVGLSGTPIYNYGSEIWSVMNALDYHCLGDFDSFSREWCYGYGNKKVKDPILLNAYLRREGLMIRRMKDDVLPELPRKRRMVHQIEGDNDLFKAMIVGAVQKAKASQAAETPFDKGRLANDAMKETRRVTGIAKAPAVAAFVRGMMEAEQPTILFAYHHDVVDILLKKLKDFKPVCITGRQTRKEKRAARETFMKGAENGGTNLIILSLRAATGLDGLQERAKVVVFGELDWSPAVHAQGEDRACRMGQMDSVLAYYLVSALGTDPEMQEALGLKVSQFAGIMGDAPKTEEDRMLDASEIASHMKKVLGKLLGASLEEIDTLAGELARSLDEDTLLALPDSEAEEDEAVSVAS